jgi:OmcA/MtrC family decaheme c-type cytochrome
VRRCTTCHDPNTATQASLYKTNPTAEACGACHDDVNFASGVNHAGGPQPDNTMCAECHIPQGELEFDSSIVGAHTIPTDSSYLTGLVVNLNKVTNSLAGQKPTVAFTLQDRNGNGIGFPTGGSISLTMAGPTTDYGYTNFGPSVTTPGYVTESVTAAACDNNGNCSYTFTNPVPAAAKGTYAIGVEARRTDVILAGTTSQQSVEYGAINKVVYFSVDGSPLQTRRAVVAEANCNRCHAELSEHGTLRNQVEYCVMCHNPSNTDSSTRPSATVAAQKNMPNQGIAFDLLVHRIHTGLNLEADFGRDYTVVGFGGSISDFSANFVTVPAGITPSGVRYPAMGPTGAVHDTANCEMCHIGPNAKVTTLPGSTTALTLGTETNLPLGLNAVTDPQGPINPDPAITAACTGCHAAISTASHALANTTALGESCQACHGSSADYNTLGLDYSVNAVHSQY